MTIQTSDNKFGVARWIVDPLPGLGTHTSIQAAINTAIAGETIFIRPDNYTGDLTLKAGVNLCSFECESQDEQVKIIGTVSFSTAGEVSISGIAFETVGAYAIENTSTGTIVFSNCLIIAEDNSAINVTNGTIRFNDCEGDIRNTGISFFECSGGQLSFRRCRLINSAVSTTSSPITGGLVSFLFTTSLFPITLSGTTASLQCGHSTFQTDASTIITQNSTGPLITLRHCTLINTTAPVLSIGAGAAAKLMQCDIISQGSPAVITGSGTLQYCLLSFETNSGINVTTLSPLGYLPIVNPVNPGFLAFKSAVTTNATGAGTIFPIVCNSEVFDLTSNYDNATGIFTAPRTGRYKFDCQCAVTNNSAAMTLGSFQLVTTARTYQFATNPAAVREASANGAWFPLSTLTNMAAGDTAFLQITVSNGAGDTASVVGSAALNTYFSGYLAF